MCERARSHAAHATYECERACALRACVCSPLEIEARSTGIREASSALFFHYIIIKSTSFTDRDHSLKCNHQSIIVVFKCARSLNPFNFELAFVQWLRPSQII